MSHAEPLTTARGQLMYKIGSTHTGVDVTLSDAQRRRHLYIVGKTGAGKSVLLHNLMRQDFAAGRGFALIDPHGDLSQSITDSTPKNRIKDTLYFDPLDDFVMGFNPLSVTGTPLHRATVASEIVASFKHVAGEFWGPRLEYILTNALRLLLDKRGSTLVDLPRLLVDDLFRKKLIDTCEDEYVRNFWLLEFDGWDKRYRRDSIGPIQNKVGQFATDPILRAVVGHKSTFNIRTIMDTRKVLICNFSKAMGEQPAHLLGAFMATAFYQAAQARADMPEAQRQDFTLYVDEFQNFSTDTFATILSEARKYRLNLVIAHQYLGQLPEGLRQAVMGNVGAICAFRMGSEDAQFLKREIGVDSLADTPNYEAWLKRSESVLIRTDPPEPPGNTFEEVLKRTRARHARPRT